MARKKTVKKRVSRRNIRKAKKKKPKGESQLLLWLPLLGQSLLVAMVLFGFFTLFTETRASVMSRPDFLLNSNSLKIQMPDWVKEDYDLKLDYRAVLKDKTLFEPNIVDDIKRCFESSYMIQAVTQVKLQMPNRIAVSLLLRRPVVKVNHGLASYYLDAEGVVLATEPYLGYEALPLITTLSSKPLVLGRKHPSKNVLSVLDVMKVWKTRKLSDLKLLEINCSGMDLNQRGGQPDYIFYVYNGVKSVKLFLDSGHSRGEIKLEQALDNLESIVFRNRHLSHVTSHVDLRWKDPSIY